MDFRELIKVGVHFGHIKARLNPKMGRYIWGIKNNISLIDVSKTAYLAERAAKFLGKVAAEGKPILWIGTKKAASEVIKEVAKKLDMPYVNHRWIGGTLSNYSQVKKSVTKLLHYEDIVSKSEKFPHYTKKEINTFNKIVQRLRSNIGGIVNLKWPIGAIVLVDVVRELSALKEAVTVGIPVVAIVDTNGDPSLVDYVIPANDDSARSVRIILEYLVQSVEKGNETAKESKKKEEKDKIDSKKKVKAKDDESKPEKKVEPKKKTAFIKKKTPDKDSKDTVESKEKKEAVEKKKEKKEEAKKTVAKKITKDSKASTKSDTEKSTSAKPKPATKEEKKK